MIVVTKKCIFKPKASCFPNPHLVVFNQNISTALWPERNREFNQNKKGKDATCKVRKEKTEGGRIQEKDSCTLVIWTESWLLSFLSFQVFHFCHHNILQDINKKLIYYESDTNWMRGYSWLMDWTEMWSQVNILMTYSLTRLDLRHDDSSVFVFDWEDIKKKAFVKSWLHLLQWISVNQLNVFNVTSFKDNKY